MEVENIIVYKDKKKLEEMNTKIDRNTEINEQDTLNIQSCETFEIIECLIQKRKEKDIQIHAYMNLIKKILSTLKENKIDIILLLKEKNYFGEEYSIYYNEYLDLLDKCEKNNKEILEKENEIKDESNDREKLTRNINISIKNEFNDKNFEGNTSNKKDVLKSEVNEKFISTSTGKYDDLSQNKHENEENINGQKVEDVSNNEINRNEQIVKDNQRSNENNSNEKNISVESENIRNNNEEKIDNIAIKENNKEKNKKKNNVNRIGNHNKKRDIKHTEDDDNNDKEDYNENIYKGDNSEKEEINDKELSTSLYFEEKGIAINQI